MMGIEYHLQEMQVASNPSDRRQILPSIRPGCRRVLDIGCGAGQTLVACDLKGATAFGIDCDREALCLGRELAPEIQFAQASGERLPYADRSFDLVVSRVALPYMHIPIAAREMARVLRPGGGIWCTLHPLSMICWREALRSPRRVIWEAYRLANTFALRLGFQFRFPISGRMESYQTPTAIKRCFRKAGFSQLRIERGRFFIVTGCRATDHFQVLLDRKSPQ